jgi:endonuclease/exonuclease/phosphatase family metal-dependent hydrolase
MIGVSVKLITWNIQWGRGADGRVDLDRVVRHAQRLADFDVLCLQEVSAGHDQLPGCDGGDQFEQMAARLPGYEPMVGVATDVPGATGGRRRFGNMFLSRLPVLQVFRHLLPWPADDGVMSMQRIAIEATLDTPQGLLRVTTTHLEYHSARQRVAQIDRLRELHREAFQQAQLRRPGSASDGAFEPVPRAAAAVLVGDFNFKPDDPEYGRLLAPIDSTTPAYRDAWEVLHPGRPCEPTVGLHDKSQWPGPPFACDFICVSADIASRVRDVRVDGTTDASDHQPMLLELA